MGYPGASDSSVPPSVFRNQREQEFQEQVHPISSHQPSGPPSSTDFYDRLLPYVEPLVQHPSRSFRPDEYGEWSHRTSQLASGPSSGQRDSAEEHMRGRSYHSDGVLSYPQCAVGAGTTTPRDLEGVHVRDGNRLGVQPIPQQEVGLVHVQWHEQHRLPKFVKDKKSSKSKQQGVPTPVRETKSKKWKQEETLVLLKCMVGDHFRKGKQGLMHWDLIVQEINAENAKNGWPLRSKEQCQNRFDILLKAFKELNGYCLRMGKQFCDVTEDEKRALKLATPLGKEHKEWYDHLQEIYDKRSSLGGESSKRRKCNKDDDIDVNQLGSTSMQSMFQSPPGFDVIGSRKSMNPLLGKVVGVFNELDTPLKYTFLNLIQVWSICFNDKLFDEDCSLEVVCRLLAILQDENVLQIVDYVHELEDYELVEIITSDEDFFVFGDCWMNRKFLQTPHFLVYEKLVKKVLSKRSYLNTFCKLSRTAVLAPNHILTVLALDKCEELENIDMRHFPNLRCLSIKCCAKLKVVDGWEGVKALGWVHICKCRSYPNLPDLNFLSSLKEFAVVGSALQEISWQLADFRQCVQLRRLHIERGHRMVESMNLGALRFLEVLSFFECTSLSTIHGLSGLHALKKFSVRCCKSLKRVPDLGYLKVLTHLHMAGGGIVEIPGVVELHLLIYLDLDGCKSLKSLPPLGHLKALAHLSLISCGIEEIPGVEQLVSLEILDCWKSELKHLPNLDHLCRLRRVIIEKTPLSRLDPSRFFIRRYELNNAWKKEGIVDVISDLSDSDTNDWE